MLACRQLVAALACGCPQREYPTFGNALEHRSTRKEPSFRSVARGTVVEILNLGDLYCYFYFSIPVHFVNMRNAAQPSQYRSKLRRLTDRPNPFSRRVDLLAFQNIDAA